jgi:hypothetical protein
MRHICLLVLLLLAAPAWAKTVPVPVGGKKTVKLTPQQVQFMRWFRAKTATVKRSQSTAQGSIATQSAPTIKARAVKVRAVKVRAVKVRAVKVRKIKVRKASSLQVRQRPVTSTTTPHHRTTQSAPIHGSSLGALKAVLIEVPKPPNTSTTSITVTSAQRRRTSRGQSTHVAVTRVEGKRPRSRHNLRGSADRLVILQTPNAAGVAAVPPVSTLTTLRLQLELSQME